MNNINLERKTQELHEALAYIVNNHITNSNVVGPTIVEVKLSADLSYAKIFVVFISKPKLGIEALTNAKGFIKTKLAKMLQWRKVPDLNFVYDELPDKASRIDKILDSLK
ncbi:30S ribosome-binding factor RbfA [Mycoplasmopsis hyopharyngis]|uniref:30S ribosome-binding factor RbfA n=1 Tax=Mycoplasmopsis hyopharyngis TaxID=29558 RepID=UPI003872C67C